MIPLQTIGAVTVSVIMADEETLELTSLERLNGFEESLDEQEAELADEVTDDAKEAEEIELIDPVPEKAESVEVKKEEDSEEPSKEAEIKNEVEAEQEKLSSFSDETVESVNVDNADDLEQQIKDTPEGGSKIINITGSFTLTNAINVVERNITIRSSDTNERVLTQTRAARHFQVESDSTLTLEEGIILDGNDVNSNGGGVNVASSGLFIMDGSTLRNNRGEPSALLEVFMLQVVGRFI